MNGYWRLAAWIAALCVMLAGCAAVEQPDGGSSAAWTVENPSVEAASPGNEGGMTPGLDSPLPDGGGSASSGGEEGDPAFPGGTGDPSPVRVTTTASGKRTQDDKPVIVTSPPATTRHAAVPITTAAQADPNLTAPSVTPSTGVQELPQINKELTPVKVEAYYGRSQLVSEPAVLEAYIRIASAADSFSDEPFSVADLGLGAEQIAKAFQYYRADYPQHFWVDAYSYSVSEPVTAVSVKFNMSRAEAEKAEKQVQAAAATVLGSLDGSMSEYELEKRIHDWLVQNVAYDTTQAKANIHNLYGALVNRVAVCDGYSRAFQYLLYQAGIPCLFVAGDSKGEPHAWNMAKIGGAYYWVDVTWDDPVYSGFNEQDKPVFYGYFNITTEQLQRDHTVDDGQYPLPDCTATAANYFTKNGGRVTEFRIEELAPLLKAAEKSGAPLHLYVEGDAYAFLRQLSDNWSALLKASGLNRGAQFLCTEQEVLVILR